MMCTKLSNSQQSWPAMTGIRMIPQSYQGNAFMKYGLQAKIGRMDGVIVAYHNTAEIFGFQYIPLDDMERCVYGAGFR